MRHWHTVGTGRGGRAGTGRPRWAAGALVATLAALLAVSAPSVALGDAPGTAPADGAQAASAEQEAPGTPAAADDGAPAVDAGDSPAGGGAESAPAAAPAAPGPAPVPPAGTVATVESLPFPSLDEALAHCSDGLLGQGPATVVLWADVTTTTGFSVPAGDLTVKAGEGVHPTVTLRGHGGKGGALDRRGAGTTPLFDAGAGARLTLSGLTLRGTSAWDGDCQDHALRLADGARVTLVDTAVEGFVCPGPSGFRAGTGSGSPSGSGSAVCATGGSALSLKGSSTVAASRVTGSYDGNRDNIGTVYLDGSTLELHDDASIEDCASWAAGAAFATNGSTVTMDGRSSVRGCTTNPRNTLSNGVQGGAFLLDGGSSLTMDDDASITGCTVLPLNENGPQGQTGLDSAFPNSNGGGAVFLWHGSTFTMRGRSTVSGCRAQLGAAVMVGRWQADTASDSPVFTMEDEARVTGNHAYHSGTIQVCASGRVVVRGSAQVSDNVATGDCAAAIFCDNASLDATPSVTLTDDACVSGNRTEGGRQRENGQVYHDITSASAIGTRRSWATVNVGGNAHVVGNTSNSAMTGGLPPVTAAINLYYRSTLHLSGNAVVANNTAPRCPFGAGVYLWPKDGGGAVTLSGAPTVTGNTGAGGRERDILMSRLTYSRQGSGSFPAIQVAGPLTGGAVGIAGGPVLLANGARAYEADETMAAGQRFAFTAAPAAAGVGGLDRLFNNDSPGLRGVAGSGNAVVWGRVSAPAPDVPPTDPDPDAKLTVSKRVTGDGADRSHGFAMETVLAAPYQNVKAAVYDDGGALDREATAGVSILCWDGPAHRGCPADEYGCATQTLVTYALKDGQHLSVWGVAAGTAFETHEVDPLVRGVVATDFLGEAVDRDRGVFDPSQTLDGAACTSEDGDDVTLVSGSVEGRGTSVAYTNALARGSVSVGLAVKGPYADLSHRFAFEAAVAAPASAVAGHVRVENADGSVDPDAGRAVAVTGDGESATVAFFLKDGQHLELSLWAGLTVSVRQCDPLVAGSGREATSESPYVSSVAVDGRPAAQDGDGRRVSAATSAEGTAVSYVDELPSSPATGLATGEGGPRALLPGAACALAAVAAVGLARAASARGGETRGE